MNDYCLIYEKTDAAKYISHLDFVRVMGRMLRRASLPAAYSEGFNPHPLMVFALPLPVGYTSGCELMELRLAEEIPAAEVESRLRTAAPAGINVLSVREGKSRMKRLRYALYRVTPERMPASAEGFLARREIVVEKKTKSGVKDTDIRADIIGISLAGGHIDMTLSAGSDRNLKPDVVMRAMNKYIDGYDSGDCEYHRAAIYDDGMEEIK